MIDLLETPDKNKGAHQAVIHDSHNGAFVGVMNAPSWAKWKLMSRFLANIIALYCFVIFIFSAFDIMILGKVMPRHRCSSNVMLSNQLGLSRVPFLEFRW